MNTIPPSSVPDSHSPKNDSELMDALLASRRRWKSLTQLVADLIFETDGEGRFSFFEAGSALGWADHELIGESSTRLLPFVDAAPGPNPFRTHTVMRGRRCWIKRADGSFACLLIYATPLQSPSGQHTGVRGLGIDVSDEAHANADLSVSRLHSEIIRRITTTMRSRALSRLGIPPAFEELAALLGAAGGILISETPSGETETGEEDEDDLVYRIDGATTPFNAAMEARLREPDDGELFEPRFLQIDGHDVILCRSRVRYNTPAAMALWRNGLGVWGQDDANLADAALATFAAALEMNALNRTLARNARFDPLTGMLNRSGMIAEISRRLPRLDRERLSGTLLVIGLDRFADINARFGFEAGDSALQQVATYLRDAIRPTDLAGRLGGDIFGLWLDGADHFVAAERAETFCQQGAAIFLAEPVTLTFSVGLAARSWETGEGVESLIDRASLAMRSVKLAGGARWHTSMEESSP
ncbi:sensor domain-containing diguanylate cyclase [Acetobacter fallax]|uniref:Diguanylate cyclase n=1 Tax=Acetobacter fallax TaxID=1737473 RepID=A0ABX0KAM9_9PROT|nr:diguanylate cyclase [Acetobacter fallax]NHO33487.1 diguanylate cyclase [Acetobacter fallax]NHO37105.1 diguanylate cyclase [Acetobacter fallax]